MLSAQHFLFGQCASHWAKITTPISANSRTIFSLYLHIVQLGRPIVKLLWLWLGLIEITPNWHFKQNDDTQRVHTWADDTYSSFWSHFVLEKCNFIKLTLPPLNNQQPPLLVEKIHTLLYLITQKKHHNCQPQGRKSKKKLINNWTKRGDQFNIQKHYMLNLNLNKLLY